MWGILVLKHTQNPYSAEHPELLHAAENTAEQVQSNLHSWYFSFSVCSNTLPEKKLIFCKKDYQLKQRNSHFKEIFLFFKGNLPHLSTAWLETPEARVGSWGLLVLPKVTRHQEAVLLFKRALQLKILSGHTAPEIKLFPCVFWKILQICPSSSTHESTFDAKNNYISTQLEG